jgi:hypothetical protein
MDGVERAMPVDFIRKKGSMYVMGFSSEIAHGVVGLVRRGWKDTFFILAARCGERPSGMFISRTLYRICRAAGETPGLIYSVGKAVPY